MSDPLDEHFRLSGDEDGDVGITCRLCDSGGQPVAYYGWRNPYAEVPEVTFVELSITALIDAARQHLATTHHIAS